MRKKQSTVRSLTSSDRWVIVSSFWLRSDRRSLVWLIRSRTTSCQTHECQQWWQKFVENNSFGLTLSWAIFCSKLLIIPFSDWTSCSSVTILDACRIKNNNKWFVLTLLPCRGFPADMHTLVTQTCCWIWTVSSETFLLNCTFASTVSVSSLYAHIKNHRFQIIF